MFYKRVKKIRYFFEFLFIWCLFHFFRLMGMRNSSAIGGKILRFIGPYLRPNKRAVYHIKTAMPELEKKEVDGIILGMWENLGRYVGEFAHLENLTGEEFQKRVELEGVEHIEKMQKEGKGGILFSGHFANWEIMPKMAYEYGLPIALVYRHANNKWVNKMLFKARSNSHNGLYNKGSEAARGVASTLRQKGYVGMLVDQKMRVGMRLKFFNRDAMTAIAPAQFALKFDCPILPVLVQRKKGAYFKVKVFPPLEVKDTGDKEQDIKNIMQRINDILEEWVRQNPSEWLWIHRRWVEK